MRTPGELTAEDVISAGSWDRRYARVLVAVARDRAGIALVDTNGDGANIDVDHLELDGGGRWRETRSSGPVPEWVGVLGWGRSGQRRYAYGRASAEGRHRVRVPDIGEITVTAVAGGWWAWLDAG